MNDCRSENIGHTAVALLLGNRKNPACAFRHRPDFFDCCFAFRCSGLCRNWLSIRLRFAFAVLWRGLWGWLRFEGQGNDPYGRRDRPPIQRSRPPIPTESA